MVTSEEVWHKVGPVISGAVFGAGWWMWVDAVVCAKHTVSFPHYLPGICASFAALMFNVVRRDELYDYSPYDDGAGCRSRTWLFLSYVISFVSLAGAAAFLVVDSQRQSEADTWQGAAGVLQCACVLGSGLIFWLSRSHSSDY